jgi:aspartate racemase
MKLGIIGGMGPWAGVNFAQRLITKTSAKNDKDHIPFVLFNSPTLPDRTECILMNRHNLFINEFKGVLNDVHATDVTHIIITCNTAHFFIDQIKKLTNVNIYDMVELTSRHVKSKGCEDPYLLASAGTIAGDVYKKHLPAIKTLSDDDQKIIMTSIYEIKSGDLINSEVKINSIIQKLKEDYLILGCTELSLIASTPRMIDPVEVCIDKILKDFKNEHSNPSRLH